MKLLVTFLAASSRVTEALRCISCSQNTIPTGLAITDCYNPSSTVFGSADVVDGYCYTQWEFDTQLGVEDKVNRDVATANSDSFILELNSATSKINPTGPFCSYANGVARCTYTCTAEYCNNGGFDTLNYCHTTANDASFPGCGNGVCNLLSGTCECNDGWTGTYCDTNIATFHECVQCDSLQDPSCATKTTATRCESWNANREYDSTLTQNECATSRIVSYDNDGIIDNEFFIRGCASIQDEAISILDDSVAITAVAGWKNMATFRSTCRANGCNTDTPNGIVTGTEKRLWCVQCDDNDSTMPNCGGLTYQVASPCENVNANHCTLQTVYTTVHTAIPDFSDTKWFSSTINDNRITQFPAYGDGTGYHVISTTRGCAVDSPIVNQCTSVPVKTASGAETAADVYTCQEKCTGNGCNDGWPNRPKCYQCGHIAGNVGNLPAAQWDIEQEACRRHPTWVSATTCASPHDSMCYTGHVDHGHIRTAHNSVGVSDYDYDSEHSYFYRRCSSYDPADGKKYIQEQYPNLYDAMFTNRDDSIPCHTDGCNYRSSGEITFISLFALIVPALFL